MDMLDWAENEVKIACKKINPDWKPGKWDYDTACYESALKAFKSLCEDGHSGFSFSITRNILIRLMNGQPLTPIKDTNDIWKKDVLGEDEDGTVSYQCKRKSSLFKDVHPDGTVTYRDVDRVLCVDISNEYDCFTTGSADRLIDKLYPVAMPYAGRDKFKFLVDQIEPEEGCYTGIAFIKLYKNGDIVDDFKPVYILYTDGGDREVSKEEWEEKKNEHHNG